MISVFGIISLVVLTVSVCAMILHFRVIKQRSSVDENFAALDNLLRLQLEIIYEAAENLPEPEEIREMCEIFSEYETRKLYKSIPKLRKVASLAEHDELSEIILQTENSAALLNEAIEKYNAYTAKFPAHLMVGILGLSKEKPV